MTNSHSSPLSTTATFLTLQPVPAIIGGNVLLDTGRTFDVIRPDRAEHSRVHSVVSCGPTEAAAAADAAAAAFPAWKATSFAERRKIFLKAAELLSTRAEEYTKLTVQETPLDNAFATFELAHLGISGLEETAAVITQALKGEFPRIDNSGKRELIQREPFGVVVGISPWNAPFFLALRAILNPLAAGNTCVLKTSEHAPRTNMACAQLLYDAGLPHGVLSVVHSAPEDVAEVTRTLIHHPAVRKVNFTGSTRVGRLIAVEAAKALKPCVLELGGKAPQIILDDANIPLAANNAIVGAFINTGQVCMATTLILVDAKVEEAFLAEISKIFKENSESLMFYQKGPSRHIRALFSAASAQRAHDILDTTLKQGAFVHAGEQEAIDLEKAQIPPLVISGIKPNMRLFTEEAFAPLLAVSSFTSDDEAIQLANSNAAGLAASVYGGNETRALRVANQIEAGQVHVNSMTVHDHPTIPHGGWKESGYGRFNGVEGIKEFSQTRTITISEPAALPFFIL